MPIGNKLGDMLLEMRDPNLSPQRQGEITRLLNELGDREEKYKAWLDIKGNVDWKYLNLPFYPIYSEVLATDKASISIDVPQSYKHLIFFGSGRNTAAGTSAFVLAAQFNGDSGSNYIIQEIHGLGSTPSADSGTLTQASIGVLANDGNPVGVSGSFYSFLPHYTGSFHKAVHFHFSYVSSGASIITLGRTVWGNTASISKILLQSLSGSIKAGTVISIYGIK